MIDFKTLCQQASQFQQMQQDEKSLLHADIQQLRTQLETVLGLTNWTYQPEFGGENKRYVEISEVQFHQQELASPEVSFKLSVVLDNDPTLYPKQPYGLVLKVGFIQSDRLYYYFLDDRNRKISVNLGDSLEVKYCTIIDIYTKLLSSKLVGKVK